MGGLARRSHALVGRRSVGKDVRQLDRPSNEAHLFVRLEEQTVALGDLARDVEILVFFLAQPSQRIGVDQSSSGCIGSIGSAAV